MHDNVYATRVFVNALDHSTISNVKATAEALSHSSNYWIPRDIIESGHGATPTECAVAALLDLVSPSLPPNWAGAEYWVQIYESGRGLAFHFDKDEHAMKEEGRMVNPILSSVLYLTGDAGNSNDKTETDELIRIQAPTVVNDQLYNQETQSTLPDDPTSSTFIFPWSNSYCVFDGRLGHGVLESACKEERITLLVNWWQIKPENIERIDISSNEDINTTNTSTIARKLRNVEETCSGENINGAEAPSTSVVLPECIYPETMEFTLAELGENPIELVDEFLRSRGKNLTGKHALHAVTIKHPGLCLYPVDTEQLIEIEEENNIVLHIGAGLGPIVPSSSSSSSSSSESND